MIGAAFFQLFGDTKAPEVVLFKTLKKKWDSLNLDDLKLPEIPASYKEETEDLLSFINSRLEPQHVKDLARGDYKEYLELAKIILGGSIDRKKGYTYHIQRPGADHHARWMSKAIYILKMSLLHHQLGLHWRTKKKIQQMALFAVFVYLEAWFTSGSLFSAASNDLKLYSRIQKFSKVNKKVSCSTAQVINRHTWYLTEDLVPLAVFVESLSLETRNNIAKKISQLPSVLPDIGKPTLPALAKESSLIDFVGPRSTLLFSLLEVPHSFLDAEDWISTSSYSKARSLLQKLTPLNDSSERALALATTLNSNMTRNEESFQELVQAVESHRKSYGLETKEDLKKLY